MPGYIGFQLAVDLARFFPQDLVTRGFNTALNFARELRMSGSDIVVEEDLADVFGRGRVSTELAEKFKSQVQEQRHITLSDGCDYVLAQGPGPTMLRAFREPKYLSTAMTLSMFAYFQNSHQLAVMISRCMTVRCEADIPGASGNPGFDGIRGTIEACRSQSEGYPWHAHRSAIEQKLRSSIPGFQFLDQYVRITPALLLGAMDFLYIAQSLPEDRKVVVSDQTGCIPLVIWAHDILGLSVAIKTSKGEVVFGKAEEVQICIMWSEEINREQVGLLHWGSDRPTDGPTIQLLDNDITIILTCEPQEEDKLLHIDTDERHPLEGYGSTYLTRALNSNAITPDNDIVYEETANLIASLAVHFSRRLDRKMKSQNWNSDRDNRGSTPPIYLEVFRILTCTRLMFSGIEISNSKVDNWTTDLEKAGALAPLLRDMFIPFLKRTRSVWGQEGAVPVTWLEPVIRTLAKTVFDLAHIKDLEQCAKIPLRLMPSGVAEYTALDAVADNLGKRALVGPFGTFYAVMSLLSSSAIYKRDDTPADVNRSAELLCLASDYGWSVYFDTFGDADPTRTRPELICVRRGTPTNARTKERKNRIRDAAVIRTNYFDDLMTEFGGDHSTYLPRAIARATREKKYGTTNAEEFQLAVYVTVKPSEKWAHDDKVKPFEEVTAYGHMQEDLWQTFSTPSCSHPSVNRVHHTKPEVKLGSDAVTLIGIGNHQRLHDTILANVLIYLTLGESRIRWIALKYTFGRTRETLLRTDDCCEECALEYALSLPGKWALIL